MNSPVSLTIDGPSFQRLYSHLFPGDGDEHGAVIAAGIAKTDAGTRLLARDIFLAHDHIDYVPGTRGYRALTARFVAEKSSYCAEEKLCYLAVHCHSGRDYVNFSSDDMASHVRGYPALVDITNGGPVGALVFATNAVAGDIWTPDGRLELSHVTVIGPRIRRLYPSLRSRPRQADPQFHRHTLLFGDIGQDIIGNLKIGIIGLGGGGSLLNEWLSRLGVGHIVAIDFDRVDVTNLPRIVGATRVDALAFLTKWRHPLFDDIRRSFANYKVNVAQRVARQANSKIRFDAIVGNVLDEGTARLLRDVDYLLLASDSMQSRLVFNALVYQYLIPGAQVGVRVSVDRQTGCIADIHIATRPVLPYSGAGCLECHQLIPPNRLREEALTNEERHAQRYVDDETIAAPSVITLNALSSARAANDIMMMFTGLYQDEVRLPHQMEFPIEHSLAEVEPIARENCLDCGSTQKSRRARGDRGRLPCRETKFGTHLEPT